MGPGDKILFFFSALGTFNGFILGVYFIFLTSKKLLSHYFLGALLLALSIRIGKSVAYFFDPSLARIYLQVGLTACFFIGPFLFFFIKCETRQIRKLPRSWSLQLAGLLLLILTVGVIYPYQRFPFLWGQYLIPLIYLQWGLYVAASIMLLVPTIKRAAGKVKLKFYEKWILTICGAVFLIFASYVWAYLNITKGSYITGALHFSLIIYLVVFTLLYRKKTNDLSSLSGQKYGDKKLDEE